MSLSRRAPTEEDAWECAPQVGMARSPGAARSGVAAVRRRRARIPRRRRRIPASPGPCSASCRCSCSACGCSRPRRRARRCSSRGRRRRWPWARRFETFLQTNPDVIREPWYPLFNLVGLTAATVASAAFISMFATFPTGIPERRWQRISVWLFWVPVVVAPLSLLVVPHVLTPEVHAESGRGHPEPVRPAGARLGGPDRGVDRLLVAGGLPRARGADLAGVLRRPGGPGRARA